MRKKALSVILIFVLLALMSVMLVACTNNNFEPENKVGGKIVDENSSSSLINSRKAVNIGFKFTEEPTSILHHIYVNEFNLNQIKFYIIYSYKLNGKEYLEYGGDKDLTEDMIDEDSKPLLKKAGRHRIHCTYDYAGKKLTGSFELHLKNKETIEFVTLQFKLNGGNAQFGSEKDGFRTIDICKDTTLSWSEFISEFRVSKPHYSLVEWKYNDTIFNSKSKDININSNMIFKAVWSDNSITVNFDLNKPEGAIEKTPAPILPPTTEVYANEGMISRPEIQEINRLKGYAFVGWYDAPENGSIWNFNSRVGKKDFTLYAHWVVKTYTLTYFLLGGNFLDDATSVAEKTNVPNYAEFSQDIPYKLTFERLIYNHKYSEYTSTVETIYNGKQIVLDVANLNNLISKGNGYYNIENWYSAKSYEDENVFDMNDDTKIQSDLTLYAKWKQSETITDINKFYLNYLYKDSIIVKADGTLKIDQLKDGTVNEVEIPNSIEINGVDRPVTEIGARAFQNSQALIKVDMSNATSLTKISESAFEHCIELKDLILPTDNNIEYIGKNAFLNTKWQNNYKKNNNEDFIIINDILCRYVGDSTLTEIVLPENVKVVGPGSFHSNENILKVVLNDKTKRIENLAFERVTNLQQIVISEDSQLEFIGENAFDNTNYLKDIENKNIKNKAIVIGDIYYRYVGLSNSTAAVIPDGITIIAPKAFVGYSKIENIDFENNVDQNIKKIGKDAFTDTKWISKEQNINANTFIDEDGFVVVNGFLVNYVGKDKSTVTIPNGVETIVENAFGGYAFKVENISINKYVEKIENRAFEGAKSLVGISFRNNSPDALIEIEENAFSDEDGILLENLKIYLQTPAYKALTNNETLPNNSWKVLYNANNDTFVQYKAKNIEINYNVLPTKYLSKTNDNFDFIKYWRDNKMTIGSGQAESIKNGVFVTYSDGITYTENLYTLSCSMNGAIGNHEASVTQAGVTTAYDYEIISGIKDAIVYDKANDSTIMHGDSNDSPIKIEGLKSHYYTSQDTLDISKAKLKFLHVDGKADEIKITENMISGYINAENTEGKYIVVTLNFEGLKLIKLIGDILFLNHKI